MLKNSRFLNAYLRRRNLKFLLKILTTKGQSRYAVPWLRSLSENYLIQKPSPWITFQAIDFIEQWIGKKRDLKVFEYGSGGSTLYWEKYSSLVVSIEHDEGWADIVQNNFQNKSIHDYRLVLPEKRVNVPLSMIKPDVPEDYGTDDAESRDCSFYKYVTQIEDFEDHFFDLILIDGRSRPACIMHSVNKIKKGGMIIIDNADRDYYFRNTKTYLRDFQRVTSTGVGPVNNITWQTNLYLSE